MKLNLLVYDVAAAVIAGCSEWHEQAGVGEYAKQIDVNDNSVNMTEVDCSAQDTVYRVSSREKRAMCPSGGYLDETSGRSRKTGKTRYCYVLNVTDGDCLKAVNQCRGDDSRIYLEPQQTICVTK